MAVDLPDPADWLRGELARRNISQNELSRRIQQHYGVSSSSAITQFGQGKAGAKTCISIALGLNAPVDYVLALCGHYPPPARMADVRANQLLQHWRAIESPDAQQQLLDFALFLVEQQYQPKS